MSCRPNSGCCSSCGPGLSGLGQITSARELTNLEILQFRERHPDVDTMIDMDDSQLSYPAPGLAVLDPSGRYVLVWRDASRRWHYVDLATVPEFQTIAAQVNAPRFVSDPDLLGLVHDLISNVLLPSFNGLVALGVLVVGFLIVREFR